MKDYLKDTIETYDKTVKKYKKNTLNLMPKREANFFISQIPKGGKILDVGCSFGRDCKFFVDKGYETYGIDLSKNMIKEARKYEKRARYYVVDIRSIKFPNNYFDGIWCTGVLHHIRKRDVLRVLKGFNKVIKKGGILYINAKHGKEEAQIVDTRYNNLPKFYSFFYLYELKDFLRKSGFKIIKGYLSKRSKYSRFRTKNQVEVLARK